MKEYAIGEEFCHEGETLRVVEDGGYGVGCEGCYFINQKNCNSIHCSRDEREDEQHVYFVKVKP